MHRVQGQMDARGAAAALLEAELTETKRQLREGAGEANGWLGVG